MEIEEIIRLDYENQPRVPGGNSEGGQFAPKGGGGSGGITPDDLKRRIQQNKNSPSAKAVSRWGGGGFSEMNRDPDLPHAKEFFETMKGVEPFKSDKPLWRGMSFKSDQEKNDFLEKLKANHLSVNGTAMSTSKSLHEAVNFAEEGSEFPLMVKILNHKSGRDFEPLAEGALKQEKEVLFLKGSKFKMVSRGILEMKNGDQYDRIVIEEV